MVLLHCVLYTNVFHKYMHSKYCCYTFVNIAECRCFSYQVSLNKNTKEICLYPFVFNSVTLQVQSLFTQIQDKYRLFSPRYNESTGSFHSDTIQVHTLFIQIQDTTDSFH